MLERHHLQQLIKRIKVLERFLQVMMAPSHAGKTTMVTQLAEQVKVNYLYEALVHGRMGRPFGSNANQHVWVRGYPGSATLTDDEVCWKHM